MVFLHTVGSEEELHLIHDILCRPRPPSLFVGLWNDAESAGVWTSSGGKQRQIPACADRRMSIAEFPVALRLREVPCGKWEFIQILNGRSEERRVGKECRSR